MTIVVALKPGEPDLNFQIDRLGECRVHSPMQGVKFVDDEDQVLYHSTLQEIRPHLEKGIEPPVMEMAGPRHRIYFDPSKLKCGIVTCGGLCPGINDVIRAIVLGLYHHYGVRTVFGFRYGFEGLIAAYGHPLLELTPDLVSDIHHEGGTILGSSRGPQDVCEMVDTLERLNVGLLFAIGGDGTLKGAGAVAQEIKNRGLKIGVVGVPKTIDNDISYVGQSFGFVTAISEARLAIYTANVEALGGRNGIGLVKLMGRDSGFIAAYAALAMSDVNFCLVPEVPFTLEGFLEALKTRLQNSRHAVVVVAEGAGQDLMGCTEECDASGNIYYADIGPFLKDNIKRYFKDAGMEITLKYIDPSYIIRSVPAVPFDAALCLSMGFNAVHAGMAGRTNLVIGQWNQQYMHVPISLAVTARRKIDPDGRLWSDVLSCTRQPRHM